MGIARVGFWAETLRKRTEMTVFLPDRLEDVEGPLPVVYLLHGLSDDHTVWSRNSNVERYASIRPWVLVCPDAGRGYYTDAIQGPAWERYLVEDVFGFVETFFNVRRDRGGRAVSGFSMGGYGAMRLAFRHPEKFVSATGHSGAYRVYWDDMHEHAKAEKFMIFGPDVDKGTDEDAFGLAEKVRDADLPDLRLDCGVDDFLLPINRDFHAHLESLGIDHEYEEHLGSHNWDYVDTHIQDSLRFHAKRLFTDSD